MKKKDEYGYNRYLDSLHLKASEIFSLQTEAEFKVKDERSIEIAIKSISKGLDNQTIADITELTIDKIEKLRTELNN